MILSFNLMVLGIITVIYVAFILVISIKFIGKYFEYNEKTFLYMGLSTIGLATPWSGGAFNFISVVFFNVIPPIEVHFMLHGLYIPISNFFWVITCSILLEVKLERRKWIIIISGIIYAIVEIIYIVLIFTNTTILGKRINEIQVDYAVFSELFLLGALLIMVVLGFWISINAMKLKDRRVRLKGRLLFSGFVIFVFAAILEIITPTLVMVVLTRILVMFCSILLYGGIVLPKWMEKIFLKE